MKLNNSTKVQQYYRGLFIGFLLVMASFNYSFATPYRTTVSSFLWSDYTSWEVFSGSWIAASPGQIPGDFDDVTVIDGSYIRITGSGSSCLTLALQGSGVVAMQGDLSVKSSSSSAMSIPSGTFAASSGTLSVTGGLSQSGGSFNSSATAIVSFGAGLALSNATITGSATITGDFNINGVVQIFNSVTVTSGDVNVNSGGNFNFKAGSSASLTATSPSKTFTVDAGGTLTLNPGTSISCKAFTTVAGATSITLNGNLNINGGVWTNGGAVSGIGGTVYNYSALNTAGGSAIALTAGGILNGPWDGSTEGAIPSSIDLTSGSISSLGVTSTIKLNGAFLIPTGSFAAGLSTISTYGTSSITAGSTVALNNVTVNSGSLNLTSTGTIVTVAGTVSNSGTLNVSGLYQFTNLTNSGGLTNTGTISINGIFTDNGSLSSSSGTFDFNGTGAMSISSTYDISTGIGTKFFNLTHSGSGTLTSSTNFEVSGAYQNTGTGTATYSSNTVAFTGTSINGGVNGTTFNDMLVKSSLAMFNSSNNKVNLNGVLTLNASGNTFDASGNSGNGSAVFTIKSSGPSATGSIAAIPTGSSLSGKMTIERWLNSGTSWKYLSIPISSTFYVSNLQAGGFNVNGHFASGGSDNPSGMGPIVGESMFTWDAPTQEFLGIGWGAGATSATLLSNTVGYTAYYYGAAGAISFTGAPSTGAVNIPVDKTKSPYDNLIPNPYPSAIDYKKIYNRTTSLAGTQMAIQTDGGTGNNLAYITYVSGNPLLGASYSTVNASSTVLGASWKGEIALGQSFWINPGSTTNLQLLESDKISAATFVGRTNENSTSTAESVSVRLSLTSGEDKDETVFLFTEKGSLDFTSRQDFVKKLRVMPDLDGVTNKAVNIYSIKGDNPLVFNFMPLMDCNSPAVSVRLGTKVSPQGQHTIKFANFNEFSLGYVVKLVDKFLSKEINLTVSKEYGFNSTDQAASYSIDRFELKLEPMPLTAPSIVLNGTKLTTSPSKFIQWYKDGKIIEGATKDSFFATESGSYSVKSGYSLNCQMESIPVVLAITGIDKETLVSAYPNPVGDELTINYPNNINFSGFSLFDNKGSRMKELNATRSTESSSTFEISDIPAGLYIIRLKSEGKNYSIKILKK